MFTYSDTWTWSLGWEAITNFQHFFFFGSQRYWLRDDKPNDLNLTDFQIQSLPKKVYKQHINMYISKVVSRQFSKKKSDESLLDLKNLHQRSSKFPKTGLDT